MLRPNYDALPPEAHAHLDTTYPFPGCLFSSLYKVSTKKFSYEASVSQVCIHALRCAVSFSQKSFFKF